jgi:hypothetical protein
LRAQVLGQEAVKRGALYAEFVIQASKRFVEAWRHQGSVLKLSRVSTRDRTDARDPIG